MSLNINPYVLRVEDDTVWDGRYLVAIYRVDDVNQRKLIGVPLRGVTKSEAQNAQAALKFAFEFGIDAGRADVVDAIYRLPHHALVAP